MLFTMGDIFLKKAHLTQSDKDLYCAYFHSTAAENGYLT